MLQVKMVREVELAPETPTPFLITAAALLLRCQEEAMGTARQRRDD